MKTALIEKCNNMLRIIPSNAPVEAEMVEPKHILVVDDNALVLRNVKDMLEPAYKVSVANKEHIVSVLELGPEGYILKPPVPDKLLDTIETVLNPNEK